MSPLFSAGARVCVCVCLCVRIMYAVYLYQFGSSSLPLSYFFLQILLLCFLDLLRAFSLSVSSIILPTLFLSSLSDVGSLFPSLALSFLHVFCRRHCTEPPFFCTLQIVLQCAHTHTHKHASFLLITCVQPMLTSTHSTSPQLTSALCSVLLIYGRCGCCYVEATQRTCFFDFSVV